MNGIGIGMMSPMISSRRRKSAGVPGRTTWIAEWMSASLKPAASSADCQMGM